MLHHLAAGMTMMVMMISTASAQQGDSTDADTTRTSFGAFVDVYYAYDFGRPKRIDRAFTTQAQRHNEFNVNLAYVEAKLDGPRVHGRMALQAGTSVQANYAGEYTVGTTSGPSLAQHIQEAYVGVKVGDNVWVDGGIFLSHIGMESFISRDNLTYTRSLAAEYTPYYETGIRVTWQTTAALTTTVVAVNGWQNISEDNQDKAAGVRLDYAASSTATLSYYDFFGNEAGSGRLRILNGVGIKVKPAGRVTVLGNFDYGAQRRGDESGMSAWYGTAIVGHVQLSPLVSGSVRLERYDDPDQVIVTTNQSYGLRVNGVSVGIDVIPAPRTLWRTELRGLGNRGVVFPNRAAAAGLSRNDGVLVTSIAATF